MVIDTDVHSYSSRNCSSTSNSSPATRGRSSTNVGRPAPDAPSALSALTLYTRVTPLKQTSDYWIRRARVATAATRRGAAACHLAHPRRATCDTHTAPPPAIPLATYAA